MSAAKLLNVSPEQLAKTIVTKSIKVRFQVIVKTLEMDDAYINRDSMSKALYSGLFQYLVWRMNRRLMVRGGGADEKANDDDDNEDETYTVDEVEK